MPKLTQQQVETLAYGLGEQDGWLLDPSAARTILGETERMIYQHAYNMGRLRRLGDLDQCVL